MTNRTQAARRVSSGARVLCLCPSAWDKEALARPAFADDSVVLYGEDLVDVPSPLDVLRFDPFRWADKVAERFRGEGLDGVIGTGDYPGCMFAALLAERLGLPGPNPQHIVQLSHKVDARLLQRPLVPEAVPDFEPFDPLVRHKRLRAPFPLFVKPVKGTMSIRARAVANARELAEATSFGARELVEKMLLLRPFQQLNRRYGSSRVPAHWFVAEPPLSGVQVTVDGFCQHGKVTIQGVVDSVMYPGTSNFARFEYPSRLPEAVQARLVALAQRLCEGLSLNATCFNVEFFWNEQTDRIGLIEINPRMSYQFGNLYEAVDGLHTYAIQRSLALGTPVAWHPGRGPSGAAASFVLRRFRDAEVTRVPTPAELAALTLRHPGLSVKILCEPGKRLSHYDQDVGSYRYAIANLAAPTRDELHERWADVERGLEFGFRPVGG